MRMKLSALILGVAVFKMCFSTVAAAAEPSKNDRVVKDGMMVSLQMTLSGEDGKMIESSTDKDPVKYVQGQHMIPVGLENELAGMKVGQEKHVKLAEAYGPINPRAFQEIPKNQIPPNELKQIKVGSMVPLTAPNGETIGAPVSAIKERAIVVNLNHPMAGKTLVFDVKVLDIQPFTPPPANQPPLPAPGKPAIPAPPK